jgi:hypothetical protein
MYYKPLFLHSDCFINHRSSPTLKDTKMTQRLEAQLNVHADAAATLFQMEHGTTRYIVPLIAGNTAQLVINNKTVTYGYVKTIQNAYAEPLLRSYIGTRNQWNDLEMSTIDWISLRTACNHHHAQRHFTVKLSHNLLPMRERTKKYDS